MKISSGLTAVGYVSVLQITSSPFQACLQNCEKRILASSCLSVRPSVCPHAKTLLPLDGFSWNLILVICRKSVEKIQASLKSDKNKGYTFLSRSVFFRMKNVSDKFVEKLETHILCSITTFFYFFRKSCRWQDNVEKYCGYQQVTDDNMAHARCMLDTKGYKYTYRLCNIHCFRTATMVALTCSMLRYMYIACLFLSFFFLLWQVYRSLTLWRRNFTFKFSHILYLKCE